MIPRCEKAADLAAAKGIDVEILDLRTLMPYDGDAILETVSKTGRLVVVYEAARTCGFGAEVSAFVAERAIEYLEAPIIRVTGADTPFPYSLEHEYLPTADRVIQAIRKTLEW